MTILGLGGLLNDAAAAVVQDGRLVAAAEQKKVARRFRRGELPGDAINGCLKLADVGASQVDYVAIVRPFAVGPEVDVHLELRGAFPNSRIVVVEHHLAHAASAYYASPFKQATVLTLDRAGDFCCGARWKAEENQLILERELYYPDSLGELCGRLTALLGFEPRAEEHKVQWLSTFGDDHFKDLFLEIISPEQDGWPRVDQSFFRSGRQSRGGFSAKFYQRLGLPVDSDIPQELRPRLAAGLQRALESTVERMAGEAENLCLAGGVAQNVLLVAALERCGRFQNVFVQPAGGNAGTALGAAFHVWHSVCRNNERVVMENLFLGPSFSAEETKQVLENCKLRFRYLLTTGELIETAVREIHDNKIVAWMHGRMEFGPRALGNRSILASPLDPYSTENLNIYIKHREPFRKFAASVPAELAGEYFEAGPNARFLATVGRVRPAYRKRFESAMLGDGLVRVHTVTREDNPLYWELLHAAGRVTRLPVLYNTSFNLFGDPIVCTPRDAVRSFYSSGIDAMFVGHFLLKK
jgi:carbamoyltransferase